MQDTYVVYGERLYGVEGFNLFWRGFLTIWVMVEGMLERIWNCMFTNVV